MITVEHVTPGQNLYVGTPGGELALGESGVWTLQEISYVRLSTNAQVNLDPLRDGSRVLVDGAGVVVVTPGPDLVGASVQGFGLAMVTVGIVLGVRWAFLKMASAVRIGGGVEGL